MIFNLRVVSRYDVADALDFFSHTTLEIVKSGMLSITLIIGVDAYLIKDIIETRKAIRKIKK